MLNLTTTSTKLQVITGSAGTIRVEASWVDYTSGSYTPGDAVTPISTATTTDIVSAPASSHYKNVGGVTIANTDASVANAITFQKTDGANVIPLWYGVLQPSQRMVMTADGYIQVFSAGGILLSSLSTGALYNWSTASQGAGFSSDTYLTGSNILIPAQRPRVGTLFRCRFSVSKTAAGTATPIIQLRYGTAASTADTSLCSFTFSAGTAATDVGWFEVNGLFRSVGSGTSAVVQGHCALTSQPTTGFSSLLKGVQTTSSGFDSTTANTYLGVSVNGGTSASWTVQMVQSSLENI
jgi:hypothetical protein